MPISPLPYKASYEGREESLLLPLSLSLSRCKLLGTDEKEVFFSLGEGKKQWTHMSMSEGGGERTRAMKATDRERVAVVAVLSG